MAKKYTPAIFQPTVRPSWAGTLSYIPEKEKSDILEAIIKYPQETKIQSIFWEETIKPDLDEQYEKFLKVCEMRGRGAKTYWGEHKLSTSSTYDKDMDNLLKVKGQVKVKDKVKGQGQYAEQNDGEKEKLSTSYPQVKEMITSLANNLSAKNHSEIKGKTVHIVEGEFFMDETMPDYKSFLVGLSEQEIKKLWGWIRDKYYGQHLPVSKIQQMIKNFNTNLQKGA